MGDNEPIGLFTEARRQGATQKSIDDCIAGSEALMAYYLVKENMDRFKNKLRLSIRDARGPFDQRQKQWGQSDEELAAVHAARNKLDRVEDLVAAPYHYCFSIAAAKRRRRRRRR